MSGGTAEDRMSRAFGCVIIASFAAVLLVVVGIGLTVWSLMG